MKAYTGFEGWETQSDKSNDGGKNLVECIGNGRKVVFGYRVAVKRTYAKIILRIRSNHPVF